MLVRESRLLVIIGLVMVWFGCAAAWADTIRLKNGRIFEGEVIAETEDEVRIEMKKGVVIFSRNEIASIGDRQISEKDIKEAAKTLNTQPTPKKTVTKKTAKTTVTSKSMPKKVPMPVKKVEETKSISGVAADTVPATLPAISTAPVPAASSETVTLPLAVPAEMKKEVPKSNSMKIVSLSVLAIIAVLLVVLIIARRKSRT